jgi:hypothetical protein
MPCIGLIFETTADNAFGRVMLFGLIESIDTSAFASGDVLYISPATAGLLTATKPSGTDIIQAVGRVLVSGVGNGSIQVSAGTAYTAAAAGGANVGEAEVDFGAFPGLNEASVAVTGQAGIIAGSKIVVSVSATATADHTVSDATYAASLIGVSAGAIVAATGFTIYARSFQKMQGKFLINYSWA